MLPTAPIPGSLALQGPLAGPQASFLQPFTQFLRESGGRGRDWSKGLWAEDALPGAWVPQRPWLGGVDGKGRVGGGSQERPRGVPG